MTSVGIRMYAGKTRCFEVYQTKTGRYRGRVMVGDLKWGKWRLFTPRSNTGRKIHSQMRKLAEFHNSTSENSACGNQGRPIFWSKRLNRWASHWAAVTAITAIEQDQMDSVQICNKVPRCHYMNSAHGYTVLHKWEDCFPKWKKLTNEMIELISEE